MLKKIITSVLVALMLIALPVFSADVTVTTTNDDKTGFVAKNSWTATTGVDSALCIGRDGFPVFIANLTEGSRQLSAQLETAEATASSVDKIFVWFLSNHKSPVKSIASGPTFIADWTEAKRDTFLNTIAPASYFDISTYSGMWVTVLVYETAGNTAVAESARIYSPGRSNESLELYGD